MLNDLSVYEESGRKAGNAQNHQDAAFVKFEWDWFQRALRLESAADRVVASETWSTAYRAARRI